MVIVSGLSCFGNLPFWEDTMLSCALGQITMFTFCFTVFTKPWPANALQSEACCLWHRLSEVWLPFCILIFFFNQVSSFVYPPTTSAPCIITHLSRVLSCMYHQCSPNFSQLIECFRGSHALLIPQINGCAAPAKHTASTFLFDISLFPEEAPIV